MRRLFKRILVGVLALATLGGAAYVALGEDLAAVSSIRIEGAERVQPAAVQRASGIRVGDNSLTLDTAAAEARVEDLSLVRDATISRNGALAIVIRIEERQPALSIVRQGRSIVLDADGVEVPGAFKDLPRLEIASVDEPEPRVVRAALRLRSILSRKELNGAALSWGPVNGFVLRKGERNVVFGDPSELSLKVRAWRRVRSAMPREPRRIDLSGLPRIAIS